MLLYGHIASTAFCNIVSLALERALFLSRASIQTFFQRDDAMQRGDALRCWNCLFLLLFVCNYNKIFIILFTAKMKLSVLQFYHFIYNENVCFFLVYLCNKYKKFLSLSFVNLFVDWMSLERNSFKIYISLVSKFIYLCGENKGVQVRIVIFAKKHNIWH